jgi:hypothetical protein
MTGTTLRHPGDPFPALSVDLPGGRTPHLLDDLADRFGVVLFCGRPFTGPQTAIPRPKADAARFPPAGVVTSDVQPADAAGSARRLQALIAIGHSEARLTSLLRHYGVLESESDIARFMMPASGMRVTVSRGMHDAICRLYDDLWDQAPPEDSPAERTAAAVARLRLFSSPRAVPRPGCRPGLAVRGHRTSTTMRHRQNPAQQIGGAMWHRCRMTRT